MAEIDQKLLKAEELAGADHDPFATPYGPTPDCFSSNDIVRMYRLGALRRDVTHIRGCQVCSGRVEKFAEVMNHQQVRLPARSASSGWLGKFGWGQAPMPAGLQALVHIQSACSVVGKSISQPVRIELVTGAMKTLHNVNVRVGGAVVGEITGWSAGGAQFPIIELSNLTVSGDVLNALKHHKRVTELVTIVVGESLDRPQVTATANVEFTRG